MFTGGCSHRYICYLCDWFNPGPQFKSHTMEIKGTLRPASVNPPDLSEPQVT